MGWLCFPILLVIWIISEIGHDLWEFLKIYKNDKRSLKERQESLKIKEAELAAYIKQRDHDLKTRWKFEK